jgi:hypothetical protein
MATPRVRAECPLALDGFGHGPLVSASLLLLLVPRTGIDTAIPDRARTGLEPLEHGGFEGAKDIGPYSNRLDALAAVQIYGICIVAGDLANPEMYSMGDVGSRPK